MSNILETALDIIAEVKAADKIIERTAVGDTAEVDVSDIDLPVRLKGDKHVHIVGFVVKRTK